MSLEWSPVFGTSGLAWSPVFDGVSVSAPAAASNKAGGRTYVIRGKRYYNLTNEQLAYLLANELIDVQRSDIRVHYGNKDRRITRGDFAVIAKQANASKADKAAALAWDDEEEAALLLL